ncbi:HK97 family phage major capsid protein [Cupriavidus phytorum]|uniref:HK97 family phage major capsid protein n=1 Tax=Cupriavidus phytorum TaxID=3024399 RepID=A0A2W7QYV3_9BURK|nr:phage major capsid protein [Cupriavidus alkaliphilus]PZX30852.1 HK97 family phage major capsid protein [Cupriavidus alkaliphilus]
MQVTAIKGQNRCPIATIAAAYLRSFATGRDATQLLKDNRGALDFMKAVQGPADTQNPEWAGALVQPTVTAFVQELPASVLGPLTAYAMRMDASQRIQVPARVSGAPNAGFVAEGAPVPVISGNVGTGPVLTNGKLSVIVPATMELAANPNAGPVLETLVRESVSAGADAVLLGNAPGTDFQPPGLLAGVTPIVGTGDAVADIKSLVEAVPNLVRPVFVMNQSQYIGATAANLVAADGTIAKAPTVVSAHVETGAVMLIDAQDFVVSTGAGVRFERTEQAVLHMDNEPAAIADNAGAIAHPVQSLWQHYLVAMRATLPITWALRDTGRVAVVTGATW